MAPPLFTASFFHWIALSLFQSHAASLLPAAILEWAVPSAESVALMPFLAQATAIPGLAEFMNLLQTISLLIGLSLILLSGMHVTSGRISDGTLCLVGGFLACVTVPLIRLIASWTGLPL